MPDKKTLMNIREEGKYHIDLPDLSNASGVSTEAIRRMLLNQPVTLVEAQLLLFAFSQETGQHFDLTTIDITVEDDEQSAAPLFYVPALRAQKPFGDPKAFETFLQTHACLVVEADDHYKVFTPSGTVRQERRQEDNGVTLFHLIFPDGTRIPEYIDFKHVAPYSRLGLPAQSQQAAPAKQPDQGEQ